MLLEMLISGNLLFANPDDSLNKNNINYDSSKVYSIDSLIGKDLRPIMPEKYKIKDNSSGPITGTKDYIYEKQNSNNTIFLVAKKPHNKAEEFFKFTYKPYAWIMGKRIGVKKPKIIMEAKKKDFLNALKSDSIKYIVLIGHGSYNTWEANDSMVTEYDIAKELFDNPKLLASKQGIFKYTCGETGSYDNGDLFYSFLALNFISENESFSYWKLDSLKNKKLFSITSIEEEDRIEVTYKGSFNELDRQCLIEDENRQVFIQNLILMSKEKIKKPFGHAISRNVYHWDNVANPWMFFKNPFNQPKKNKKIFHRR